MLGQQPAPQGRQGEVRVSLDMGAQCRFLRRRQLARPVTATQTGARLAGVPPADQRLIDVRHADAEQLARRPRRHPTVNRCQDPRPQILCPRRHAIAAPTACGHDSESHFISSGNPLEPIPLNAEML